MNRILAMLFLLAIVVIGVGFYRGWFIVSRSDTSADSRKVDVNLTVDGDKLHEDVEAMKQSATETVDTVTEGAHRLGDQVKVDE